VVSKEVENYLSTRYNRFLEYAHYHAKLARLDQQGGDVLNEVLLSLLTKDPAKLQKLYNKKGKKGYREIDFYILRMVKLNCHSITSPYRFRYRGLDRDENSQEGFLRDETDPEEIEEVYNEDQEIPEPADEPYEDHDKTELICQRFQLIRDVLDKLPITEREKQAFRHKYFLEESWSTWRGKESAKWLQLTFKKVKALVIEKIEWLKFSYTGIVAKSSYKIESIKAEYQKTLFPGAYRYSKRYLQAASTKTKYQQLLNQITGKI